MTNANIHPRLRFDNSDSSQTVSFIFTDYDSYRAPAGIKLVGNQGNEWFEAPKLIKTGSSDSYVLLGGGGHKALAQFVYAAGNLGVQESTGTSDNISRAQFWRDNNLGAYGVTLSHSDNAGYKTKIYHDYGSGGNLYMKACSNGTWGSVYTIWNSGNFDPNTKVNKAGDIMTGKLSWTMNGVTSSIGNENGSYTHHNTNASAGHWFNKNVYVSGNVYGGSSYNRILAFKDEINSQVGGSKSAQMNWASWGTDTYGGAIQIREQGLVTNKQSAWGYSPALTFHWGNRYAKRFGMRSDGQFAVDDVPISLSTHNHNSLYVTALGTNGNYLTWTKNGTTNNITVPYASNSDKLDGVHNGDVTANYYKVNGQQTLNLSALDSNKWYPCVMTAHPSNTTPIRVTFTDALSGHKPSWSTHSSGFSFQFDFEWIGGGWGTISWYLRVYRYAASFGGETACYGLEQRNNRSALVLYMRGGTSYYYRTTDGRSFTVYASTTNIGDSTYPDNVSPRTSKLNDCYLQEAGSRYGTCYRATNADNVSNADTVDGYHASGLFTNLSNSGNSLSITIGGTNKTVTPAYATNSNTANSATYAGKVRGEYTGNGGQQNPNYFGVNWVGFRMMNTNVGGNSQYKDWIISDCYSGSDVGGAVAFGMNRQALGAYLMGSDSGRGSWSRKGTFWGDWNLTPGDYYDSKINRSANTVLAAPNGSSGSATFRRLVAADIPTLDYMSKKGDYSQPIVLAAGYVYRSSNSSSSWYFSGSKVSAISSVSCSVSGGVMTITFNPSSGHSIYCYAACANMATSGDMPSYTGNYSGRSGGAEWMGTYCSGGSSIWMRQMAQSNANNDSWHSDNMNKSDGPTRITLIVCGYHS